eukprot:5077973-Heterocapsa_arctica.AAC.1
MLKNGFRGKALTHPDLTRALTTLDTNTNTNTNTNGRAADLPALLPEGVPPPPTHPRGSRDANADCTQISQT